MQRFNVLVAACAAVLAGACRTSFVEPRVASGREHIQWTHHYVLGIFGSSDQDTRDVCALQTVRHVRTHANALTLLVSIGTLGIYTPRVTRIECAAP